MDSRIPPSTEQQRISELEAALAAKDAEIEAGERADVEIQEIVKGYMARAEAAERQVAELKRSFEQMGDEHQQMYHALREVITAVGGIAEEGVSVEFACFAPGEARGRVAKLKREIGERDGRIKKLADGLLAWESMEASLCPEDVGFAEYIKALRAQLQEAQEDTERLDWLAGSAIEACAVGLIVNGYRWRGKYHGSIRATIDAARSEGGSTKGTAHSADAEGARNASDLGGDSREER